MPAATVTPGGEGFHILRLGIENYSKALPVLQEKEGGPSITRYQLIVG
jgi:hypothetical protein